MSLIYFIRNRERLEAEMPEKERMVSEGTLGSGAIPHYKEVIEACKMAELEILEALGTPA